MTTELTTRPTQAMTPTDWTPDRINLLTRTVAKGATEDELQLFLQVCQRTGLDPFARQIYAIKRRENDGGQWVDKLAFQTGIDGYRLIAERTGKYDGQEAVQWCGNDGQWTDVWLANFPPSAARVTVWKKGTPRGFSAVAIFGEYAQTTREGKLTKMWAEKPALMIAKCAEALALRKAFPQELSGLYTDAEMDAETGPPMEPQPVQTQIIDPPQARLGVPPRPRKTAVDRFREQAQALEGEPLRAAYLSTQQKIAASAESDPDKAKAAATEVERIYEERVRATQPEEPAHG